MEIRDLQFFLSVAENSSFTIAAEKENISQSSVSKAVIRLEKELGVKLFNRMHNSITLTETGRYLYDNLSKLLPPVLDVIARAESSSEKKIIRYATSIPYGCFHQPELLDVFMRQNPDINLISVYDMTAEEIEKQMREGSVDVALMHLLSPDPDIFDCHIVYQDSLYALLPPDHPLAAGLSISVNDLEGQTILYNSRHINEVLNYISKKYSLHLRSEPLEETTHSGRSRVTSKVSFNFGITVFYKSDLQDIPPSGLIYVPISDIPDIPIVLAISRFSDIKDHHAAFLRYIWDHLSSDTVSGNDS